METQSEIGAEENSSEQKNSETLEKILALQEKNSRQLEQALRESIAFHNQVRIGMQRELDALKEQLRGDEFTPILKSVAAVCVEYRKLFADETVSRRTRKTLKFMFDELEEILSEYDAEIFTSGIGEPRRPLLTKIVNTIPTDDKNLHNTIAQSRRPGVIRNGRTLYREFVDVYVYDENAGRKKSEAVRTE